MEGNCTLSVVIPAYNCEKTIAQTLDSLIGQKSKDLEIIIVNDGSADNTEGICKEYCDKYENIKYFYKENSGVSDTRNIGIDNATGKYIAFLDSDDAWDKNYYDDDLNKQLKEEEYDIFAFSSCFSDMDFNITEYVKIEEEILIDRKDKAVDRYYHHFSSFIYKYSFLRKNNIFFCNKVRYGEDELFRSQCLYLAHNIFAQDKLSFYYRNNVNSATKVNRKQKLFAQQKLEVYYLMKEFFYNQYEKEGNELFVKNSTTAKYFIESIKLLSEMGYGYSNLKALCAKENAQLINDNIDKYYGMYYIQHNLIKDYLKSPLMFYIKHRFHGLWFYTALEFKHWLVRLKNRRK